MGGADNIHTCSSVSASEDINSVELQVHVELKDEDTKCENKTKADADEQKNGRRFVDGGLW